MIPSKLKLIVIGAGGHAKVAISTFQAMGKTVDAVYDDDSSKWGSKILGVTVVAGTNQIPQDQKIEGFIGIGNNTHRKALAQKLSLSWVSAIHPRAFIHETVEIGRGVLICAGACVQPSSILGAHSIINTHATIDHDCRVGAFAHIGPGANLCGNVHVDEGGFVGAGSSVIPGLKIGSWSIVGAGAAVIQNVPEKKTAVGVPAKIIS